MEIQHEQHPERGAFYIELDGTRAGEMTYRRQGDTVTILHTEVSDRLRGQSAGKRILEELVRWVRAQQLKVVAVCPFAKATFAKRPELQDVLAR